MIKAITGLFKGSVLKTNPGTTLVLSPEEKTERYVVRQRPADMSLEEVAEKRIKLYQFLYSPQARELDEAGFDLPRDSLAWAKERVICIPRLGNRMVRSLPQNPTEEDLQYALQDSIAFPREITSIPTKRFGEDNRTVWMFGKHASNYGELLSFRNIKQMHLFPIDTNYLDTQKERMIKEVLIGDTVEGWSELYAN